MKKIMALLSFLIITTIAIAQDITGTWNGQLEVQKGRMLLFIFNITKGDNTFSTEIAIPSQGVKGVLTSATTLEGEKLVIDASNVGFKYTGTWSASAQKIEGVFQEGVNSVPLTLTREELKEAQLTRPQEPVKPYPYQEENVLFENKKAGVKLAGTLTLPAGPNKKAPAVILISGSGPQDRDESFATHKPFLVLADYLTRRGIAVLRYDDRGFGESTGNFAASTTADFASDVKSAMDYLMSRQDIDHKNIGLIGHSEGAIIAPMVANQCKDVAFIVMLAGTGTSGKQVSLQQAVDFRNFPVADEQQYEDYIKKAIDIAAADKEVAELKKELTEFYNNSALLASLLPPTVDKEEFIQNLVATRTTPWVRYFYNYDPADEIERLKVPALALYGSKDTQVPPKYHLEPVQKALTASKSKNQQVILMDGLNHLFQPCETGSVSEYPQIEQTFAPEALKVIGDWVIGVM